MKPVLLAFFILSINITKSDLLLNSCCCTENPEIDYPPGAKDPIITIFACAGKLRVLPVPENTFFKSKYVTTRPLTLSLYSHDVSQMQNTNWLQFDSKNQQFYGVPLEKDIGNQQYRLHAELENGAVMVWDFFAVVRPSPTLSVQHNVEISMTLLNDTDYYPIIDSTYMRRLLIEKISELFHDKDTGAISLDSITENTIIRWHNTNLLTSHLAPYCPDKEIAYFRRALVKHEQILADRVDLIMGPEFSVKQITLTPTGPCVEKMPEFVLTSDILPAAISTSSGEKSQDDVTITYVVPAVIKISKRSGNISLGDQENVRQSFVEKGIPVIFLDELERSWRRELAGCVNP